MDARIPFSIEGVVDVERIDGAAADPATPPALLVEIPHGADRRAHYDALRGRLVGDLPKDLNVFFHANTDVGAWNYGRRAAEMVVAAAPERSALVVRCLVPRTFIDTNRLEDATEDLAKSGLTAGIAPYVRHPADRALLLELHRAYVGVVERAVDLVCGNGGFGLCPHTYGPRTMGIAKIDDAIVEELRRAHEPEAWAGWPLRPEIDFITKDPDGAARAPEQIVRQLLAAYRALGLETAECATYTMHPSTQGARWAARYPDRFLCLEVRRDLLVETYTPFEEMRVRPDAVDRIATPLATAIDGWLRARPRPAATGR
ncbi:MAG: hypothetical protein HYY06_05150 [Deltaproteobacteria bacterium]|nr:hypothetical protein [Deltaproteobacteria bacterium]